MRLLVAGDTHGDTPWLTMLIERARNQHCQWIVQLGDFGYWSHTRKGASFLKTIGEALISHDIKLVWIDGNHENHQLLRRRYFNPDHVDPEFGFYTMLPNLFHAPRGHSWTWDGVRFLACGGAYSIDRDPKPEWGWGGRLSPAQAAQIGDPAAASWWQEEMVEDRDVERCAEAGEVDVLLTHDVAAGVDIPDLRGKAEFLMTNLNRERLRRVTEACQPSHILHGHYHCAYSDELLLDSGKLVSVTGLSCNGMSGSFAITDLVAPSSTMQAGMDQDA